MFRGGKDDPGYKMANTENTNLLRDSKICTGRWRPLGRGIRHREKASGVKTIPRGGNLGGCGHQVPEKWGKGETVQ